MIISTHFGGVGLSDVRRSRRAGLLRVALYITPLLQGLAPQLPVESFQNQHGFRIAMFTDEAEARRWLSGITASK